MTGSKMDSSEQILEIMQRAETLPKKQPFRPQQMGRAVGGKVSAGGVGAGLGATWQSSGLSEAGKPIKVVTTERTKPVKVMQMPEESKTRVVHPAGD